MVVNQWDGKYVGGGLDKRVPRDGRWVSEMEDLSWGISHVRDRLGGDI